MKTYTFIINEDEQNKRLDLYLSNKFSELSRSLIQKLISDHNVLVNENIVKPNYKLKVNDEISIIIPALQNKEILAEKMDLNIIYEDSDIAIIDKPKSLIVHPSSSIYSGTLVNGLIYKYGENLSDINGKDRPGIVHRLDKDTSGSLVITKNNFAHEFIAKQLADNSMTRKYIAIVHNNIKEDKLTISKPIGRNPYDRKKRAVVEDGKKAITHITVLERYGKFTLIEAQLETGRTHQIRVHLASISHHVLGDTVYGAIKQPYKLDTQVLHSKTIGFVHPSTKEYIEFSSETPEYFLNLIEVFKKL